MSDPQTTMARDSLRFYAYSRRRAAKARANGGSSDAAVEYRALLRQSAEQADTLAAQIENGQTTIVQGPSFPTDQDAILLVVDALFHREDTLRRNARSRKAAGRMLTHVRARYRADAQFAQNLACDFRDGALGLTEGQVSA